MLDCGRRLKEEECKLGEKENLICPWCQINNGTSASRMREENQNCRDEPYRELTNDFSAVLQQYLPPTICRGWNTLVLIPMWVRGCTVYSERGSNRLVNGINYKNKEVSIVVKYQIKAKPTFGMFCHCSVSPTDPSLSSLCSVSCCFSSSIILRSSSSH